MNRFLLFLVVNLTFSVLYGCNTLKSEEDLPLFPGMFLLVDNDNNLTYLEVSPDTHSGATKIDRWIYNYRKNDISESGTLSMSEANKIGSFKVQNENYTIRWSKKNEQKSVLIESNGVTSELLQMNLDSEYNNGVFLDKSSTTSFEVNPKESILYGSEILSIISFEGRFVLPKSDEYLSGYALASPIHNLYYFICPDKNKKYDLNFDSDEHSYTLNIDGKTIKYLYSHILNRIYIHPGNYFFESSIAGKCEIEELGDDKFSIRLIFNSEFRKNIKEVLLNIHLDANKAVIESSSGVSTEELSIWIDGKTIEIKGIQDEKIYINTGQE